MVLKFLVLVVLVVATHAEIQKVFINRVILALSRTQDGSIVIANTTYEFRENELAYVECDVEYQRSSIMKFVVQDGPSLPQYQNRSINMWMAMRAEHDGKYIDCIHKLYREETVVRVMLKLKRVINYYDYDEPGLDLSKIFNLDCLGSGSEYSTRILKPTSHNVNGLKGFNFSKILYSYCHPMGHLEVHYEYKDKQPLDLNWNVRLIASKSNEYTVFFRDKLVTSFPVLTVQNNCNVGLKLKPIIPDLEDGRSVIKFCNTITEEKRSESKEIRVIIWRANSTYDTEAEQEHTDVINLSFFILIGMTGLFIITLVAAIYFIVKNKSKTTPVQTEDQNYGNLENSESITPFPSQWETYANAMESRDPDLNSIRQLYATPLPKSQRKEQKNSTYVNASSAGALAVDDGLYSVVERSSPSEMPASSKEQNYLNIVPSRKP